ncbi:MAG TPA: ABC transporter permease [Clostridia bacterium]|nr:ABC transporter permease [Clostridia bacterium]HPK15925.1 ABC transporter permease [Clostridia bacterium]
MLRYILKRLLMMIPVILGISFIIFTIMSLTPGDPARLILGEDAPAEDVVKLRMELGLDDPFPTRFARYIANALRGDFGTSYRTRQPVFKEIFSRLPTTFMIAFFGILIAVTIGLPIGIISAVKQYSLIDTVSTIAAMLLTAMPGFFVGMLLILLCALKLGILPATGIATWKHFIMPSLAVASVTMATFIRMTRSTMLEVIRQDYVRTARAKGASKPLIVFRHCLRNALLPIVTVIGMNFAHQLGGTVMIEAVFAIPGLGSHMVTAVRQKDTPVVMASIIFVAVVAGLMNLIVDILYTYIDPRVKTQYTKR